METFVAPSTNARYGGKNNERTSGTAADGAFAQWMFIDVRLLLRTDIQRRFGDGRMGQPEVEDDAWAYSRSTYRHGHALNRTAYDFAARAYSAYISPTTTA